MLRPLLLCLLMLPILCSPAMAVSFDTTMAHFEQYAIREMPKWHVPGMAIAVVKGDKTVYAKGFGTKRYGENRPVDKDTIFQVGSTTKAFTVALMATLVDEGKVGWDDRVVDHFPGFMMFDPWVTREFRIHDLFAQHSGMPAYAGDLQSFIGFDRDHIIHSLRYIKPTYSFRDNFSYVNNLFVAGAKVEETLTGQTWEQLMHERILTPLGMSSSSLTEPGLTFAKDSADLHVLVDGTPQSIKLGSMLLSWPYVYGPAGGLNSSATDMARWAAAQLNKGKLGKTRIFSEDAAAYMHAPRTPVKMGEFYGAYAQGWLRTDLNKTDVIWHNGGTSGICSFVGFSPDLDMAVVILTNLGHHKLADALGLQFFDMMSGRKADWSATFLNAPDEDDEETDPAHKLPGLPLDSYVGTYISPVYGKLSVERDGDDLMVTMGATQQVRIKIAHRNGHVFSGDWAEMDPGSPEYHFDFDVTPDNEVQRISIREVNYDGLAEFTRQ
ncbi:serine hydrolase [Pseudodesulfovibrio sp. zrk46]|uniref:serine hydrolase n=1 Tax=Pseudodesulfovibrio sp. zrk46 TaxID=2725288 RepID=UPI001449B620|nr:serine hydrolase [Pseudodesulfovibrio sp. zrk46]QJB55800.1 serine hydrolase [Pseudodesulfovibrio sp. zrk46]